MRISGCGHVLVHSSHPSEGSLTLISQPNPEALADELLELGKAQKQGWDNPAAQE
jgi:hypothetical protein